MAYIRRRGNQLALVHGERVSTGDVQQRVLFTIYSKAEAQEAAGRGSKDGAHQFRAYLERQFPAIRFDWENIRRGIEENLAVLPDEYSYRDERLRGTFRQDLCTFARQLALADPQHLDPAAELIAEHRHELGFLVDLVQWRLETCDTARSEWTGDNAFYWRFQLQGDDPPSHAEELAIGFYERGELDRAEAAFKLLLDCFGSYADGHNHLGLVALDRGMADDAIEHFVEAARLGRRRFPKRIAKDRYWTDLDTRPYVRALRNLVLALERAGRDEDALEVCACLEAECGDELTAAAFRAPIHLKAGRYAEAVDAAGRARKTWPVEGFVAAFALFEQGELEEALTAFLHAALNQPLAARMLTGRRRRGSKDWQGAREHNSGVALLASLELYLDGPGTRARRFFWRVLGMAQVDAMLDEIEHARHRSHHQHRRGQREAFDRLTEMATPEYARERARELMPLLSQKRRRKPR